MVQPGPASSPECGIGRSGSTKGECRTRLSPHLTLVFKDSLSRHRLGPKTDKKDELSVASGCE